MPTPRGQREHATGPRLDPAAGSRSVATHATGDDAWRDVREIELCQIDRERALRGLLLELGTVCAATREADQLIRQVLVRTVVGLDAACGWVGIPTPMRDTDVYGVAGPVGRAAGLVEAVTSLPDVTPGGPPLRADPPARLRWPEDVRPGSVLYLPFRIHGPEHGWLLLGAEADRPLATDVDGIVSSVAALLGLALARIHALDSLRRMNRQLEIQVARRTHELERERDLLEARVAERTRELERTKRHALETERRILDLERREGVHQLAAGVAHELNNPLGSLKAALEYVRDELGKIPPGPALGPGDLADLGEAVEDSLADADRMAETVSGLFGDVALSRRAAVRTDLDEAVSEALAHFRPIAPAGLTVDTVFTPGPKVGVPSAELTRWVFRLLQAMATEHSKAIRVLSSGRAVELLVDGLAPLNARREIGVLLPEIIGAGGAVLVLGVEGGTSLRVELPPACGEQGAPAPGRRRS